MVWRQTCGTFVIIRPTYNSVISGNLEFGMECGELANQGPVNVHNFVCKTAHNFVHKIV